MAHLVMRGRGIFAPMRDSLIEFPKRGNYITRKRKEIANL